MSQFLEIHIIQTLQASNPNRGQDGGVKDIVFGGVRRARLSSQSQKRAARLYYQNNAELREHLGVRSRRHSSVLAPMLTDWTSENDRTIVARIILSIFNLGPEKIFPALIENESNLLFLSQHELETLALLVHQHKELFDDLLERANEYLEWVKHNSDGDELKKSAKYDRHLTKKELTTLKKAIASQFTNAIPGDVALFGRMMATLTETSVDGSVQVAHALGISELARYRGSDSFASGDIDFFSAVDDINSLDGDESGAGMIGEVRFAAPTYYRYANVNVTEFLRLIGDEAKDVAPAMLQAFVEGFVKTLPDGFSRGFAHQTMPEFVLIQVKQSCPYQYAGAFEKAIDGPDVIATPPSQIAVRNLSSYREEMLRLYGENPSYTGVTALSSHYNVFPTQVGVDRHYNYVVLPLVDNVSEAIRVAIATSKPDRGENARILENGRDN